MELDIILDTSTFKFPFYAKRDETAKPETENFTDYSLKELREEEKVEESDFK